MRPEEKEELRMKWRAVRSRGELKRAAQEIERSKPIRIFLEAELVEKGLAFDNNTPAKKLLRMFLNRSEQAQIRKNPIHRNEGFLCVHCHQEISKSRGKIRDHCPLCLRGLHLDKIPGDRAATCKGKMSPTGFTLDHGAVIIHYRCEQCTHSYQVQSHPDDRIPPSLAISDLP